ncbi:hypothetical protein Tco_1251786 [Tanacetum coccineum]
MNHMLFYNIPIYAVKTGKSQATRKRVINTVGKANENQPRAIRWYNCRGAGDKAKQCIVKKRVKDLEWVKENMLLAQPQEAGVVMYEDQQDFLLIDWKKWKTVMIFSYKQHKTFKANHVDAYDLDCDDEATTSAIFMASLSPAGSHNGDTVSLTYNSDILYEVPHYDTYHENDELNSVVQET